MNKDKYLSIVANGESLTVDFKQSFDKEAIESITVFVMASFAEGFGLGIVESAKYNKPLVLRDIPVFREIAEDNAYYFDCLTGDELALKLNEWISLYESGRVPTSERLKTITWQQSCEQLMDVIINGIKQ